MLSSQTKRWSTSSAQISTSLSGDTVILEVTSGRYYLLTNVGSTLWQALRQPRSVDELVNVILADYEIDISAATHDVSKLLKSLEEAGLVTSA